MNGCAALITYLSRPRATRRSVASASGLDRSKMLGQGIDQSMHSAAVRHGLRWPALTSALPGLPCVGVGHTMGWPSHRAIRKRRLRLVGAP